MTIYEKRLADQFQPSEGHFIRSFTRNSVLDFNPEKDNLAVYSCDKRKD